MRKAAYRKKLYGIIVGPYERNPKRSLKAATREICKKTPFAYLPSIPRQNNLKMKFLFMGKAGIQGNTRAQNMISENDEESDDEDSYDSEEEMDDDSGEYDCASNQIN